jgi:SurA N-terminal domain
VTQFRPALVAALVLGVVLTGCGASKVGTAAIVGEDRISVTELQADVRQVLAERKAEAPQDQTAPARDDEATGTLQREILTRMIQSRLVSEVAAERRVPPVTAGEVDRVIAEGRSQGGDALLRRSAVQFNVAFADLDEYVRYQLLIGKILDGLGPEPGGADPADPRQQRLLDAVSRAATRLGVTVNPRYGRWDRRTNSIVTGGDGLTEPATGGAGESGR